jgi:hypothetical protein
MLRPFVKLISRRLLWDDGLLWTPLDDTIGGWIEAYALASGATHVVSWPHCLNGSWSLARRRARACGLVR